MDDLLDIKTKYFTASGIASKTPCRLYAVISNESGTTSKLLTLRDGVVATSPIRLRVSAVVYSDGQAIFNVPILFKYGLYLEFESGLDSAFVQFKQEY